MFVNLKAKLKKRIMNAVGQAELVDYIKKLEDRLDNVNQNIKKHLDAIDDKLVSLSYDEFESYMLALDFIALESTNHCSYHCRMCPHDVMTRPKGFMANDDLCWVLENIAAYRPNYDKLIHLHGTGEAFLDKNLPEKVEFVRGKFPKAYIEIYTTLGVDYDELLLDELSDKGLSSLLISCFGFDRSSYLSTHGVDRFSNIMKKLPKLSEMVKKNKLHVIFSGPFGSTDENLIRSKMQERDIAIGDQIDKTKILEFKSYIMSFGFAYYDTILHNFCTMGFTPPMRAVKPCSVYSGAYRRSLWVDWDLKVRPCSIVTDQELIFGDLRKKSLREIFYDTPWRHHHNALKTMKLKEDYPFCYLCQQDSSVHLQK